MQGALPVNPSRRTYLSISLLRTLPHGRHRPPIVAEEPFRIGRNQALTRTSADSPSRTRCSSWAADRRLAKQ